MRAETKHIQVKIDFDFYPTKNTCDGDNISPHISISGLDTPYFALILQDPDAPRGTYTHWIFWDAERRSEIPENIPLMDRPNELPGAVQGVNSEGSLGYTGPCPPSGTNHRYYVKVFGLDAPLGLSPGSQVDALERALEGKVRQYGEAMARYAR